MRLPPLSRFVFHFAVGSVVRPLLSSTCYVERTGSRLHARINLKPFIVLQRRIERVDEARTRCLTRELRLDTSFVGDKL